VATAANGQFNPVASQVDHVGDVVRIGRANDDRRTRVH
jgi:hypothetical protein